MHTPTHIHTLSMHLYTHILAHVGRMDKALEENTGMMKIWKYCKRPVTSFPILYK